MCALRIVLYVQTIFRKGYLSRDYHHLCRMRKQKHVGTYLSKQQKILQFIWYAAFSAS